MSYRFFLAGFSHPRGHDLLCALEESGLDFRDLELFDPAPAGQLTRFRGEAKLVKPLPEEAGARPEELDTCDLAFLCGEPDEMEGLQSYCAANGPPAISLSPPGPNAPAAPAVFLFPDDSHADLDVGRLLYAPSPSACVALRIARAMRPLGGLERVVANVLEPACEAHREGAQALFDQSIALVNLETLPTDVLEDQRAFNLVPRGPDLRLEAELRENLKLPETAVLCTLVEVPVFHGYGLTLGLELDEAADVLRATGLLEANEFRVVEGPEASPAEAVPAGELRVAVPTVRGSHLSTWATFEPATSGAVNNAIALAREFLEGEFA